MSVRTHPDIVEDILLAVVTRPDSPPLRFTALGDGTPEGVLDALSRHRFAALAFDAIVAAGALDKWPLDIQYALRRAWDAQSLVSTIREAELRRVLDAAGEAGVDVVLIKGAALGYTHYRRPHLRARGDTDVAIRAADRERLCLVLRALGYEPTGAVDGALVTQQCQWARMLAGGIRHVIDVHWRLFNPHAFGHVLATDRLIARAVPIAALGSHGRAPCDTDALLIACVHRVAHHAGEDDLAWAFDVHRILATLDDRSADEFVGLVRAARVHAVCGDGIASAHARFDTPMPSAIRALLQEAPDPAEPTAAFLERDRRQVDVLAADLRALADWRTRARLLREHLFPRAEYMRAKYSVRHRALLPIAYARRIVEGTPRWFRK